MTDDIRAGFIRQRRNLIIISLVLLFTQYAELTVRHLSVFGNIIEIGQPVALPAVLWVAWGYWLLRYYTYYHDLGDKGFRRVRMEQLKRLLERDAPILLTRHVEAHEGWDCSDGKIRYKPGTLDVVPKGDSWKIRITNAVIDCEHKHGNISSIDISERDLFITGKQLSRYQRRALARVVVSTRLPTEYALPFVIAALPPFYWFLTVVRNVFL